MRGALKTIAGWWVGRKLPADLASGDICVVVAEGSDYKVAKILMVDESTVHIRLHKERFSRPPTQLDAAGLTLGKIDDVAGFGIGHLPLSRSTFAAWTPIRIQRESVTQEELEGYRMWEESNGGTWG
jgi:hypothetical protein